MFCLNKTKVLLLPLTHSSPSPTEVCLLSQRWRTFSSYWSGGKCTNPGAQEVSLRATAGV